MNKRWITILIVLAVLVVLFIGFRSFRRQQASAEAFGNYQTETIQTGSLVATVGATGTVRSNQSATLNWQSSGTVGEINVAVGDEVEKGTVLAALVKTTLPQSIILAEADLVNAQNALDDLYDSYSPLALAQASQAVADAEKAVDNAQRYVDNLSSPARQTDIDSAQANLVLAKDKLDKSREAFEPYADKPDSVTKATYQNRLAQAQQEYDDASRLYNYLTGSANPLDLAVAQADLELAKANLTDAQENYQKLIAGADPDDVAAAEARVAAAEATLKLAAVEAPFSGTITAVDPKIGDLVTSATPAFRLDDLSRLLVDVQVSEVDINRIHVGQDVVLTFDAILAKEYNGKVVEVGLVGNSDQGVVNFNVTVELTDADEEVKPGMTAAVNIIVSQLDNALLVPNRAVRVRDGQRVVYLLNGITLDPVEITLGASSDLYSEVIDGSLKAGDTVVLNPPQQFGPPGPGGPGGGN